MNRRKFLTAFGLGAAAGSPSLDATPADPAAPFALEGFRCYWTGFKNYQGNIMVRGQWIALTAAADWYYYVSIPDCHYGTAPCDWQLDISNGWGPWNLDKAFLAASDAERLDWIIRARQVLTFLVTHPDWRPKPENLANLSWDPPQWWTGRCPAISMPNVSSKPLQPE